MDLLISFFLQLGCAHVYTSTESSVRRKSSVVGGLRQSTGQAEARVSELRALVNEKRGELSSLQHKRSQSKNQRERDEYTRMQHNILRQQQQTPYTPHDLSTNVHDDSGNSSLDEFLRKNTPQPTVYSPAPSTGFDFLQKKMYFCFMSHD